MSRLKLPKNTTEFHERLFGLLKNDVSGWAEKIGVHPTTIRDAWLKKLRQPSADKIITICQEAGVSCDWLLTGKEQLNKDDNADKKIKELEVENKILSTRVEDLKETIELLKAAFKLNNNEDGLKKTAKRGQGTM